MKINKLKALLIVACFFIVALYSKIKCIDVPALETACEIKSNYRKHIEILGNDNVEDAKISWISYLLPPTKIIIQSTYKIMNFAANNPQTALIIGFFLADQVVAGAANNCQYYTALQSDTVRVWGVNCEQQGGWKFFFSHPTSSDSLRFGDWGNTCDQKVGCFWTAPST